MHSPLHTSRCSCWLHAMLLAVLLMPFSALAQQGERPPYTPPEPASITAGSLLQILFSLLLVLAAVMLVSWILKRIQLPQSGSGNLLKIIGGMAVGQRERVVLLEIGDTWLVVGVAPGRVQTLHSMPKGVIPAMHETQSAPDGKFQVWLKQMMEKRNAR